MALVMPTGSPQPMSQGTYQSPQQQAAQNQIGAAYEQYLGRPMGQADYFSQTSGGQHYQPQNVSHAINQIQNSEEAQRYQASQQQQSQAPSAPAPTALNQNVNTGSAGQSYPSAPNVPPSMAVQAPNAASLMGAAGNSAGTITSQFTPQQIRDFTGQTVTAPQYNQTTFSQALNPQNQQIQGGKDNLLLNLLQNPESLSQQWQDQMFEAQKDDANAFAKQFGLQQQQGLQGRGFDPNGLYAQGQQKEVNNDLMSQLLAGRRDIATQAALQNRADRLNVFGAAEQGLSGDSSRASEFYRNLLSGQQAQAGENQFGAQFDLAGQQAEAGNERDNYNAYLGGRGLQGQENARQEQFRQSAFGLSEQSRQNAMQNALAAFSAQGGSDLGWANYGLNADQQFLNYLSGQG